MKSTLLFLLPGRLRQDFPSIFPPHGAPGAGLPVHSSSSVPAPGQHFPPSLPLPSRPGQGFLPFLRPGQGAFHGALPSLQQLPPAVFFHGRPEYFSDLPVGPDLIPVLPVTHGRPSCPESRPDPSRSRRPAPPGTLPPGQWFRCTPACGPGYPRYLPGTA